MGQKPTKIICHEMKTDPMDHDWAIFERIAEYELKDTDDYQQVLQELASKDEFPCNWTQLPIGRNRPGSQGLDLYMTPESGRVVYAFKAYGKYGPPDNPERGEVKFRARPFELGEMGWQNLETYVTEFRTYDRNSSSKHTWASFVMDFDECCNSREYKHVQSKKHEWGVGFVRFPLIYRLEDTYLDIPPGMIPNHHNHFEIAKFDIAGHTPGRAETKPKAGGRVGIVRHYGPHFVDAYTVHIAV